MFQRALVCGAALLSVGAIATSGAQAQTTQSSSGSNQGQDNPQLTAPLAFKLGTYIPYGSDVRDRVGDVMFLAEAEYTIQNLFVTGGVTTLNVGFTERNGLRIIPITIAEIYRSRLRNNAGLTLAGSRDLDYYFGLGGGIYPTRFRTNGGSDTTKSLFGGFAVAGLNISNGVFVEAKVHLIERFNDFDIGGVQLTAGIRF